MATAELVDSAYQELRRLAAHYLRRERAGHTLQPTALVHEAYLRLADQEGVVWKNREHFIGIAATMMRRILVNHAVKKKRDKRGGGELRFTIEQAGSFLNGFGDWGAQELLALDDALSAMSKQYPRAMRIVELKFFGGLSITEIGRVMDMANRTVEREWHFARAWLLRELIDER